MCQEGRLGIIYDPRQRYICRPGAIDRGHQTPGCDHPTPGVRSARRWVWRPGAWCLAPSWGAFAPLGHSRRFNYHRRPVACCNSLLCLPTINPRHEDLAAIVLSAVAVAGFGRPGPPALYLDVGQRYWARRGNQPSRRVTGRHSKGVSSWPWTILETSLTDWINPGLVPRGSSRRHQPVERPGPNRPVDKVPPAKRGDQHRGSPERDGGITRSLARPALCRSISAVRETRILCPRHTQLT